jgi:hypothetical protein
MSAALAVFGAVLAAALGAAAPAAAQVTAEAGRLAIADRLPRIVYRGGPFLRRPSITTVTFAGDDTRIVDRLEAFGEMIVGSPWWRAATDGYCAGPGDCIGAGRAGRPVRLAARLPSRVRDVDVERMIMDEARSGALAALGADALVLVYLPAGVTLSDAFQPAYCGDGPRAFHRLMRVERATLPFAVIPRCGDDGETTATASHEILEAATNPDPDAPGFRLPSGAATIAFTAAGAEPVDPCGLLTGDGHRAEEGGFRVQRAWSNRAAAAGANPCVPDDVEGPYVALIPRTPAVRLTAEGATATIVLDAVSDRAAPAWTIEAIDLTGAREGVRYVEAAVSAARVESGDAVVLTLRLVRRHARQMAIVGLVSRVGPRAHVWPLAVSTR